MCLIINPGNQKSLGCICWNQEVLVRFKAKEELKKVPNFNVNVFFLWTAIFLAAMMLFKPEEVEGRVGVILYILQVSQNKPVVELI